MENLGIGIELMLVGMTTVFLILLIVINLGKLLITLVNRYAPEEVINKKAATVPDKVNAKTIAIIQAAVDTITAGKGKVIKVEKK